MARTVNPIHRSRASATATELKSNMALNALPIIVRFLGRAALSIAQVLARMFLDDLESRETASKVLTLAALRCSLTTMR